MGQRFDEAADHSQGGGDERLGEAIEHYLALVEQGEAPSPEAYAARHPDIEEDVRAALEGLELVNGLVGRGSGSHGSHDSGPGRNIESGRRIAGYRVVRELGRGGMGTVYEAVHVGLDRPVALKVLGTHAAPDSSARRRFLNEARTAAALHHTHIVPVFDVGQVGGLCYYAMQRIEGSGLDRVIRHRRRFQNPAWAGGRNGDSSGAGSPGSRDFGSSSLQVSERLNRMWVLISGNLPWGRVRALPTDGAREPAPPTRPLERLSDSTASWAQHGGLAALSAPGGLLSASPSRSAPAGAAGRDDEAPTFSPPRGSAYHRWTAEVGLQAAEALAHAHHHGVIHRDVKPSNLLIDSQGTIWVADFGLARRLADPGLTHHDSLLGTPRYMSPEQGRTGVIDGRTDVYSLGATLYELLTLRPPFDGSSAAELLDQIAGREPIPPRLIDRRIPRDLETIVLKTLAKRPADRYTSAAALGEDLARFLNREPVRARRISPVGRMWRVARRHPGITTVSTVATALVLSIAAYAYNTIRVERDQARDATDRAIAERDKTEAAEQATRSAMRTELWRHASLVRLTSTPDRRATGLDLLKKAAQLEPEPALKAKLRDEAAEFLVLRDVERRSTLPTGPIRDLAFDAENSRLSVLSVDPDGEELAVWDVNQKRRLDRIALFHASASSVSSEPGPPRVGPPNRGPGGWRRPFGYQRLALAGGNIAVLAAGGQSVQFLQPSTGAAVRELVRAERRFLSVFGEPSGKRLVTIDVAGAGPAPSGPPEPAEFEVVLWNVERPEATPIVLDTARPEPRPGSFPLIAFGADGKSLAFALHGSTKVKLFSTDDGRPLGRVESQAEVTALAAGVGGRLATASGGTIQLWDGSSGEFLTSFSSAQSLVIRLQFNPRGTLLASSGFGAQSQVELWDPIARKLAAVLPSSDAVYAFGFSPDGKTLAVAGKDASTSLWRINEPPGRAQISGLDSRPTSLAFRDDGLLAMSGSGGDTWLWCDARDPNHDPALPRCVTARSEHRNERESGPEPGGSRVRFRDRGAALAFDARGDLVAHDARGLDVWPAHPKGPCKPTRLELPNIQVGGRPWAWGSALSLARSGDGSLLAMTHGRSVFAWRPEQPGKVVPVVRPDEPAADPSSLWDFAPLGARGDASTGRGPAAAPMPAIGWNPGGPPSPRYLSVQITSAGDRLYLLDETGTVHVWKLQPATADSIEAGPLPWNDSGREKEKAASIALRSDGRLLAIGDRAGAIILVDTARLKVVGRLLPEAADSGEPAGWITALTFSPDGRRLAAGVQRGSTHVWSAAPSSTHYAYRFRLPGQCGRPSSLAFDSTGSKLAAGGVEPLVEVWNLETFSDELKRLGLAD